MKTAQYHAIWKNNGKAFTMYSYAYLLLAIILGIQGGEILSMLALVMMELSKVDKGAHLLGELASDDIKREYDSMGKDS